MTDIQPSQPARRPIRPRLRTAVVFAAVGALALVVSLFAWAAFRTRHDRAAVELLHSRDPESCKAGAWLAARQHMPSAWEHIATALEGNGGISSEVSRETNPGVRESYVHALGRSGRVRFFETVARLVRNDPDPYVRQAAWVAAARLAPDRFRGLAAEVAVREDAWDRIGRAQAWLVAGDVRGVEELLRWAAQGSPEQRRVASLALSRGVAPLLEAVGRWPLEYAVREGEAWPVELVAEVVRRCKTLNLQAIADDAHPHLARVAALRRNVGRLHRARERVARSLFAR